MSHSSFNFKDGRFISCLYRYDVEFWSVAKYCNADGLPFLTTKCEEISTAALVILTQTDALLVSRHQLYRCTEQDHILSRIVKYTQCGWPKLLEPDLKPFRN